MNISHCLRVTFLFTHIDKQSMFFTRKYWSIKIISACMNIIFLPYVSPEIYKRSRVVNENDNWMRQKESRIDNRICKAKRKVLYSFDFKNIETFRIRMQHASETSSVLRLKCAIFYT